MKKLFIILSFCVGQNFLFGQWVPVGTQSWDYTPQVLAADTTYVYAGGFFTIIGSDTIKGIAKWDGISWTGLGTGINGGVYALCVYNGILYAGGSFDTAGGVPVRYIAQWDGNTWAPVGTGVNDAILALCIHNGELYAGGNFDSAGTIAANYIAKWNGSNWSAVGSGMSNYVNALASFQGNLYAGGGFTTAGGNPANFIAKWDGNNWLPLGTGLNIGGISLASNQNFLFVGGGFTTAGGVNVNYIAQWDGNNWYDVGGGINNTYILGLHTDTANNNLYAGAMWTPGVYRWDGVNWYDVCNGGPQDATALVLFKGELYVNAYSNTPVFKCSNPVGVMDLAKDENDIHFIPNPLANKSILSISENELCNISFYNVLGKKIYEKDFKNKLILDRNDFVKAGIYFYHITTKNNSYYGKLLVQ